MVDQHRLIHCQTTKPLPNGHIFTEIFFTFISFVYLFYVESRLREGENLSFNAMPK